MSEPRFKVGDRVTTKPTDPIPNVSGTVTKVFEPGESEGYSKDFYFRFELDVPVTKTYSTREHTYTIIGRADNELC